MSGAKTFLYICMPIFGGILALILGCTPIKALMDCEIKKSLGVMNPLPSVTFLMTNIIWVIYSSLIKDIFVLITNSLLLTINFQITLRAYKLSSEPLRNQMEIILHSFSWTIILFAYIFAYDPYESTLFAFGIIAMLMNITIFIAPLIVIREVVSTKDSTKIYAPFAIAALLSCTFWSIYAVVIGNSNILVPNLIGGILSALQMVLTRVYPAKGEPVESATEVVIVNNGVQYTQSGESDAVDNPLHPDL